MDYLVKDLDIEVIPKRENSNLIKEYFEKFQDLHEENEEVKKDANV